MASNHELSDTKRKEFDDHFKTVRDKLPACPKCKTKADVIPSVQGKPTNDLLLYATEGHVQLSGCCHRYDGWCKKCEQFI
ncbi:unnamed protein product [Adineta ricciae]|uniref:Uncharacterized protein n=1 Tax=Adineta ricciae TaxID=249248 RepID=A0A814DA11_ADIRI|nr:unnamed protein product [Adineta ricciae]